MPKILLMVCSENCIIDRDANKATVINILEQLNSNSFPFGIPPVACLMLFEKTAGDSEDQSLEIEIRLNGESKGRMPATYNFQGRQRCRVKVGMEGLIVPGSGRFEVCVIQNDECVASWPILVLNTGDQTPTIQVADT
jgi:hypothetical protein